MQFTRTSFCCKHTVYIHISQISIYTTKFLACVCECETDVTSPCLHRVYSCGTVSPACKVGSGQLHVYIAVRYATPSGSARSERDSAATQRRRHEGGSSQGSSSQESREEGETRRQANAEAMREARARESREEGETRRRANTEAMREARARRPWIADRSGSTVVHAPTYTQK